MQLDASNVVSSYRKALSDMAAAGANSKITVGMAKELDKLEKQFLSLKARGEVGFTNSREMMTYSSKVNQAYTSLATLGKKMQEISKKPDNFPTSQVEQFKKQLEDLRKQILSLQQSTSSKLQGLGFSKEQADSIAEQADNTNKLTRALKKELEVRREIEAQAKKSYESRVETEGRKQSNKVEGAVSKAVVKDADSTKVDTLTKAIRSSIEAGSDFDSTWNAALAAADNKMDELITDTDDFKKKIEELIKARDSAIEKSSEGKDLQTATESRALLGNEDGRVKYSKQASEIRKEIAENIKQTAEANAILADEERLKIEAEERDAQVLQSLQQNTESLTSATTAESQANQQNYRTLIQQQQGVEAADKSFNQLKNTILSFLSITSVMNIIRRTVTETFRDVQQLDKSFSSIALVTDKTVSELWSTYNQYADMAAKLGQDTNSVVQASALFYQQGLNTKEALELTTDTMKLATLAGNDYSKATQEMTAALRGFKMEMDEGNHVTDVYSELAAHAAASVDGIAQAMSRTASIANSAGMSFENTSAFLTQMIETTQESAENIGTSLKTIIARFTELKENVAGTADSEFDDLDFNKVDKALKSVGVNLKTVEGQFRNLDEVFLELSEKWTSLDRNTQRYVATIAAGSRQQSRFIAMMDNYERTAELIDIAAQAEGKADEQFAKYADTIEYKLSQVKTKWEEMRVNFLNSDFFGGLLQQLDTFLDKTANIDLKKAIVLAPVAIWAAKQFITTFMSSVKSSASSLTKTGTLIGQVLVNGVMKQLGKTSLFIRASVDPKSIIQAKNDVINSLQESEKMGGMNKNIALDILGKVDLKQINSDSTAWDQLKQAAEETGMGLDEAREAAEELFVVLGGSGEKVRTAVDNLQNFQEKINDIAKAKNTLGGLELGFKTVGNAALTAFSMMASGASAVDVLKMLAKQLAITAAQFLIQETLAQAHEKILNKIKEKGAATRVATVTAEQAATTGAIVAGSTAQAAAAGAAGEAVGGALTTGFIAGTAGIGAIVVGIAALITALTLGVVALAKDKKVKKEDAAISGQLAKETEKLNNKLTQQKEALSKLNEALDDSKERYDLLNEAVEKYLNSQYNDKYLTNEQGEEWLSLQQEIAEVMPDLIAYYDAEGNAILAVGSAFEEAYNKQKKAYHDLDLETSKAALDVAVTEYEIAIKERDRIQAEKDAGTNNEYIEALQKTTKANNAGNDHAVEVYRVNGELNYRYRNMGFTPGEWYDVGAGRIPTAESILQGLEKEDNAAEIGMYLRDAIIAAGAGSELGISEEDKGMDTLDKLEDILAEGNTKKEQETLKILKDALVDAPDNLQNQISSLTADVIKKQHELDQKVNNFITASAASTDTFAGTTKSVQNFFSAYLEEQLKKSFEELHEGAFDENGVIKDELIDEYAQFISDSANPEQLEGILGEHFTETQIKQLESFYEEAARKGLSSDEIVKAMENSNFDDEFKQAWLEGNKLIVDAVKKRTGNFAKALGYSENAVDDWGNLIGGSEALQDFYNNLSAGAQQVITDAAEKVASSSDNGRTKASNLVRNYQQQMSGYSSSVQSYLLEQNWDAYSGLTDEQFKANVIKDLQKIYHLSEEAALQAFEDTQNFAEDSQLINNYTTFASIESWKEDVDTITNALLDNANVLSKYTDSTSTALKLNAEEATELQKTFENLEEKGITGLDEFLKYDSATKSWVLNAKEFNRELSNTIKIQKENAKTELLKNKQALANGEISKDQIDNVKIANEELEKQIRELEEVEQIVAETLGYWKSIAAVIDTISSHIDSLDSIGSQFLSDGYVSADNIAALSEAFKNIEGFNVTDYINKDLQLDIDKLYEFINAEMLAKEASGELANASDEEILMWNALKRALEDVNSELKETTNTLQDDYDKALKNHQKALEDVAEKQKALNEALEDYNELMYGTEHRDSKLDPLYNYTTRLEYLNDEIERSKDLLENAQTTQESTEALHDYADAMHSYITTLKAQQEVRKAYANESESKLLNHVETIYDPINGNAIVANYAEFIKKNADGTYAVDQLLLEQARFADAFKDELEQAVSDYNDNYKEMRSTDREIAKLEKEVADRRKNAIKNYAAMETELAEVLKAEYQKEVDDLKNKYDAMKEADDDYVNALQEAIEKQRKLRDRESKWEDLAKKEKKLSLMSRDTSGANRAGTMKLEEEIQKSREELLDEAVDDIIEGLSDLYESQQELRDTEIELKEALLENTLYWNEQAQGLAASFNSAEEYMDWMAKHSTDFAEMTLAQQQDKLNEYGETFTKASEEMAWQAMDAASRTGQTIIDIVETSGDEIQQTVVDTSEVFVHQVEHTMAQVRDAFNEDMQSAIDKIEDAKRALQEAIDKVQEYADEVAKAWAALQGQQYNSYYPDEGISPENSGLGTTGSYEMEKGIKRNARQAIESGIDFETFAKDYKDYNQEWLRSAYASAYSSGDLPMMTRSGAKIASSTDHSEFQAMVDLMKAAGTTYGFASIGDDLYMFQSEKAAHDYINDLQVSNHGKYRTNFYATGGLVDYTGPAWVDGTPEKPEAFLSAEDTARIGNAANILANLPFLNPTDNVSTTNNTYGDTSVEININIESISSPDDIDALMDRLKEEVVSIARPIGTNVILQQNI